MGITLAFLGAVVAELGGDAQTKGFTRPAFGLLALLEAGVSVDGLASWTGDLLQFAGVL